MELESNMDPNIIGGAGNNYRGLIQFGPGARQVGLPDGPMTISQQMPYVEKYFAQRGFTRVGRCNCSSTGQSLSATRTSLVLTALERTLIQPPNG